MTTLQKIAEIEAEMARTQKNKATENHIGLLKAKLSKLKVCYNSLLCVYLCLLLAAAQPRSAIGSVCYERCFWGACSTKTIVVVRRQKWCPRRRKVEVAKAVTAST
jgi:hypothetical protein